MTPFVVMGLPRSRTAWLARYLTYGDWVCGHEEMRHARSLDDVKAWLSQPSVGTAETAAAPFWRMLTRMGVRIVTVRRPVHEVIDSLGRLGFDKDAVAPGIRKLDRKLDQVEARTGCLSVRFDRLSDPDNGIFEYCLGLPFDREHFDRWNPVNVQCDMRALVRYCQAFAPAMEKLGKIAKHAELKELALRPTEGPEGVTIQTEPLEAWLKDAGPLFDDHLMQVGEAPGDWTKKNIPLMRKLDDAGVLQITTARCNGRMFGYLMSIVTPSLVSEGRTAAANTTFYADPSFPGLGGKIQRAALKALQARGVDEVFWETNSRGSGERIGALYRRLGAESKGQVYRLQLTEN